MRKTLTLLTALAMALAIVCVTLYRDLEHERVRAAEAVVRADELSHRLAESARDKPAAAGEGTGAAEPESSCAPSQPPAPMQSQMPAVAVSAMDDEAAARAERRERSKDPAWRARVLAQLKAMARFENPEVGPALGLEHAQEDAFVQLLAEQGMQERDDWLQRNGDPVQTALRHHRAEELARQHEREIAALLGEAKYAEYQRYRELVLERQQLRHLRVRLDEAHAMTPTQATQLMSAMREERELYFRERMQDGSADYGYMGQYPFFATTANPDPVARLKSAELQIGKTETFMSRLHAQAATILTAEQLKRFDEMQEEQLDEVMTLVERIRRKAK